VGDNNRSQTLPFGLGIRVVQTLLFVPLAYLAFANAIVNITRETNASVALEFGQSDGIALGYAAKVELWAGVGKRKFGKERVSNLGRRGIVHDPLNPFAIGSLGYVDELDGHVSAALQKHLLANRVSRRSLMTQLWLIEYFSKSDDINNTLKYYDISLRTDESVGAILMPVLAKALDSQEIRIALAPYIKTSAPWLNNFVIYVVNYSQNSDQLAQAIEEAGGLPQGNAFRRSEISLLKGLFDRKLYQRGLRYYSALVGKPAGALTSTTFSAALTNPDFSPITWSPTSTASIGSEFGSKGSAIVLRAFAAPSQRGVVVSKLMTLGQGRYAFSGTVSESNIRDQSQSAYWQIRCLAEGDWVTTWTSTPVGNHVGKFQLAGPTLSPQCTIQSLDLFLDGGSLAQSIEIVHDSVFLKPLPTSFPERLYKDQ
jgi:mRNA-degrading endonuclease toxin of MazEF toxin-antitoxin module